MLKVLPGVGTAAREAPGWQMMSGLQINGRSIGLNVSHDGSRTRPVRTTL
jgi:hypothetical protein